MSVQDERLKQGSAADSCRGAFDGKLPAGKHPALLVVDVVVAYLDPTSPLYAGVEDALASNERLLAAARERALPVIFTNVAYDSRGANGGLFFRKVPSLRCFLPGSELGRFPATLQPSGGELVVTKQFPSAFFGTPLAPTLVAMGIDSLLITGFSTSGCIRATALDALCHGFVPLVVREACGDRHPAPHEANLFDIQAKVGEVISEQEALAIIARSGPQEA